MSDSDRDSAAWRRPPSDYLAGRPARASAGPGEDRFAVASFLDLPLRAL